MTVEFEVQAHLPALPETIYTAWLDSVTHSLMTGGEAIISPEVMAEFSAWDGYITGKNLELEPGKRIVQAWRTVEFSESDPDSRLEILLATEDNGTKITLIHTNLPEDGMQFKQGWIDNYFDPMKTYFDEK
jgi:activator of HSP90 ATPase